MSYGVLVDSNSAVNRNIPVSTYINDANQIITGIWLTAHENENLPMIYLDF